MSFKRKFHKLKKDPKAFFQDTKLIKFCSTELNKRNTNIKESFDNLKEVSVSESGFVHLPDVGNYSEHRVIFLFDEKYKDFMLELKGNLLNLIKKERIHYLYVKEDRLTDMDISRMKFNNETKKRLVNYSHLFVVLDNDRFSAMINHIYHNINVTYIRIQDLELSINSNFTPNTFIFYQQEVKQDLVCRNAFYARDVYEVSLYIKYLYDVYRKRAMDYLVPVISSVSFRPELLSSSSDVLVILNENYKFKAGCLTHREQMRYLAKNTEELFVKESVFIKYNQTLSIKDIFNFYCLATYDNLKMEIQGL